MSPQIINEPAFAEILAEHGGWADIDTLYLSCMDSGVFGADFHRHAFERAAKDAIRRMLKSGKVKDADGNFINVASIIITDETGRNRRVYKQETLFEVDDFVQVCRYWKDHIKVCKDRLKYYVDLAVSMHGRQIQGMLDLND